MNQHPHIALITGAGRGIGHATALDLHNRGITVIAALRKPSGKSEPVFPDGVITVELDVTKPDHITGARDFVLERFGKLDILINNAGIYPDRPPPDHHDPVEQIDADLLPTILAVNVEGPLRLIWAFLPNMRQRGHGRIVNVSSGRGRFDDLDGAGPLYRISKTALNALTVIVAADTRGHDILVNAVCPGWTRTAMGGPDAPRRVEDAAAGVTWAALLPAGGPTGGFFRDGQPLDWCRTAPRPAPRG